MNFGRINDMVCLMACCFGGSIQADERSNIVLIMCDDLGYADVGFNGSKDITTPHLDRLANNGAIFTSTFVAHPFCGPSRMALMTGRYPHSIGAPFNLPNSGMWIEKFNQQGVPVSEKLISAVLQVPVISLEPLESGIWVPSLSAFRTGAALMIFMAFSGVGTVTIRRKLGFGVNLILRLNGSTISKDKMPSEKIRCLGMSRRFQFCRV